MPSKGTSVCVECRRAQKTAGHVLCGKCGQEMTWMGTKWIAPKATNSKAWRRIAKGEWWWDRRRIRRVDARTPYRRVWRGPSRKKGQEGTVMRSWRESGRELGG